MGLTFARGGMKRRMMGSIVENLAQRPAAVQHAGRPDPVELYHHTNLGERHHRNRDCWALRQATIRGMRSVLPGPNCWRGVRSQRDRNATEGRGWQAALDPDLRADGALQEPAAPTMQVLRERGAGGVGMRERLGQWQAF